MDVYRNNASQLSVSERTVEIQHYFIIDGWKGRLGPDNLSDEIGREGEAE
jgi:hypothetical protein